MMAAEHECKHEVDFALLFKDVEIIKEGVAAIEKSLAGNGQPGIKTTVELIKQSLGRAWWFIGIITVVIIGASIKALLT